jgi:hypothetical protein
MAKFNKFVNSNEEVFLNYNKTFSLPKCVKLKKKKCSCFDFPKTIDFSYEYPLSAIHLLKNHVKKTLLETEKHNNHNVLSLFQNANCVRRITVKNTVKDHLKTLEIFRLYFQKSIKKKKSKHFLKYMIYLDNQISKCRELLSETVPWEYNDLIPLIILKTSLYAHYHSLKLFENFVNKNT